MAYFPTRNLLHVVPLILGVATLVGCETQGYDPNLRYGLRTDPVLNKDKLPTVETRLPDRPGQLPLMSMLTLKEVDWQEANPQRELTDPLFAMARYYLNRKPGEATDIYDPTDPKLFPEKLRAQLERRLETMFGTPARPRIEGIETVEVGSNRVPLADFKQTMKLEDKTLIAGSKLYRIHCLHCHGLAGDGRGPTAPWVNPHPRDYRLGMFKYVSSGQPQENQKPRRADILRVLTEGIDGTSMPAFNILSEEEREAITSYVIHLSLRGQTEYRLLRNDILPNNGKLEEGQTVGELTNKVLSDLAGQWYDASWEVPASPGSAPIARSGFEAKEYPADYKKEEELKASIQRGIAFITDANGCAKCHVDYGRASTYRFDAWGTMARPRDFTAGIYRGGRRPIDLYWRVALGINGGGGATMTPFKDDPRLDGGTDDKGKRKPSIWDVVNAVQALPYPAMREKYGIKGVD